ncbi:stage II sporulation protein R [Clostridium sp. CTA-19]
MKSVQVNIKKIIASAMVATMTLGSILGFSIYKKNSNPSIEEVSKKIIRFHVIANSDDENDQAVKLKVRDNVLKYISPKLKDSKSIGESREILKKEDKEILDIAQNTLKENGYNYKLQSTLSNEYFPVKTYGNITLPQGKYEAYRIIIGNGEGQNWWCVMFPPLCFVDVEQGKVAYQETEKEMKEVLDDKEYDMVNNLKNNPTSDKIIDNTQQNDIVIKSKAVETIKEIIKK